MLLHLQTGGQSGPGCINIKNENENTKIIVSKSWQTY